MSELTPDARLPAPPPPALPVAGARGLASAAARTLVNYAERAMVRASDAAQVRGNHARLLVDGSRTFPAWLRVIEGAERWIHLENYILRDDKTGRRFREALCDRARDGVRVRLLHDWFGCWATPAKFFKPLKDAGVDVRAFGPPRLYDPLAFLRRDHRKVLAVDGGYASVTGMCIGDEWAGDPDLGIPAWRDTGAEFRGPVSALIDRAFSRAWAASGAPLPPDEIPDPAEIEKMGDVSVRVVEGEPGKSRIYRLQQFVAVGVERRFWITDPYFVLPPAMTEALASAARDGVDVRVIVPAYNNWPIVGGMSRAGYRPLLEAGVRIFEWEGPMIHAKTAVADGMWARVGSTNMNLASLLGNWEIDVAVTDRQFAAEMEALFLEDLASSVEISLIRSRVPSAAFRERRAVERMVVENPDDREKPGRVEAREARRRSYRGSEVGRTLGRLARAGSVLGRALVGERMIGREDTGWIAALAVILLALATLGILFPRLLAIPLSLLLFWLAVVALVRVFSHRRPPEQP
ncbi:MAG TPA: phospholipase D-like domain-containing protein [Longimicrobium sp.]|nr:phospholipase D-like domain-containing protein [Longimicrobium sp.]